MPKVKRASVVIVRSVRPGTPAPGRTCPACGQPLSSKNSKKTGWSSVSLLVTYSIGSCTQLSVDVIIGRSTASLNGRIIRTVALRSGGTPATIASGACAWPPVTIPAINNGKPTGKYSGVPIEPGTSVVEPVGVTGAGGAVRTLNDTKEGLLQPVKNSARKFSSLAFAARLLSLFAESIDHGGSTVPKIFMLVTKSVSAWGGVPVKRSTPICVGGIGAPE